MAKKKASRNKRKKAKFERLHPGMTRTDWARQKRVKRRKNEEAGGGG